jgi:GT2 family glycosyltransferase
MAETTTSPESAPTAGPRPGLSLSVVVVTYRTWPHVERLLGRLHGGTAGDGAHLEIVVVDNDPDDASFTALAAAHPGARFLKAEANWGFAAGCNLGARASGGTWLVFINPDVEAERADVVALVEALRGNPSYRILTAPQVDARGRRQRAFGPFPGWATHFGLVRSLLRRVAPGRYPDPRSPLREGAEILPVDWVSGSLLAIARRDFASLGGWCDDYWMYCEDQDLCRRAADRGWRTGFFPRGHFLHHHGAASRGSETAAVLTKSETVISKHLYLSRHYAGWPGATLRAWIRWTAFLRCALFSTLDGMTLHSIRAVRIRAGISRRIAAHFRRGAASGSWISDRSKNALRTTLACAKPGAAHPV